MPDLNRPASKRNKPLKAKKAAKTSVKKKVGY